MKATGWLLPAMALLLGFVSGGWLAWTWRANAYGKALTKKVEAYSRDREQAAMAVISWQGEQQDARWATEDRLQASDETHYKELHDEQAKQVRLRGQLATADVRWSVLLNAAASGGSGGVSRPPAPAARFKERREPNLTQRLLNELSPSPETVTKD
ncbi:lysis protein [Pseudomonas protegens]|uniref:lysis protein n=1 Tax=Pseudomonas protegens TaxID=380021 RepID=UPI0035615BF1